MIIDDNAWSVKIGMFAEITCLSRKITCHIWVNNLRNKKLLEKNEEYMLQQFSQSQVPHTMPTKGTQPAFSSVRPLKFQLKRSYP